MCVYSTYGAVLKEPRRMVFIQRGEQDHLPPTRVTRNATHNIRPFALFVSGILRELPRKSRQSRPSRKKSNISNLEKYPILALNSTATRHALPSSLAT